MEAATVSRIPERSLAQRRAALAKAQHHRIFRADVKKQIKRREVDALTFLLEPPEQMANMKIYDLLLAVPKWGRSKVNRALTRCRVSPSKTLAGLSERQRSELTRMLLGL